MYYFNYFCPLKIGNVAFQVASQLIYRVFDNAESALRTFHSSKSYFPLLIMFRSAVLKMKTMPLRMGHVKGFWLVENKHLAFAAFVVGASMYALLMQIMWFRMEIKNDVKEVRTEIRTSLAAMNTS